MHRPHSTAPATGAAERESSSFGKRAQWRRGQAASSTTGSGAGVSDRMLVAVSRQLPQLEPQPVRIISSDIPAQPEPAASRISESVTP